MKRYFQAVSPALMLVAIAVVHSAPAHAGPVSFTFQGQLASGSEGAFDDGAAFWLTFVLQNDGASLAEQSFDLADFMSVTLVSGDVTWNWDTTNATVPLFSGFQTNSLGQLMMGNGVFLRAGLYDLATFASSPFGAASLNGEDRATSEESVLISDVGVFLSIPAPPVPVLLGIGVLPVIYVASRDRTSREILRSRESRVSARC